MNIFFQKSLNISGAAFLCLLAMIKFTKTADIELFFQLTSSPWLDFSLESSVCENAEENEVRLAIKSLTSNLNGTISAYGS